MNSEISLLKGFFRGIVGLSVVPQCGAMSDASRQLIIYMIEMPALR